MIVQVSILSTKNLNVEDREAIEQLIASRDDGGVGIGVVILGPNWKEPYNLYLPEQPIDLTDIGAIEEAINRYGHLFLIGNSNTTDYVEGLRDALYALGRREAFRPNQQSLPIEQRTEFWW